MKKVTFYPQGTTIEIAEELTVLQAAIQADVHINAPCGGKGTCNKCKIIMDGKEVLACQTMITKDMNVTIPLVSAISKHKILERSDVVFRLSKAEIDPLVRKVYLELVKPSLSDNLSDLERIKRELKKDYGWPNVQICLPVLRRLSNILRKSDWRVTLTMTKINGMYEIIDIESGNTVNELYGLVLDIGTTTVVAQLVNLIDGEIVTVKSDYNAQISCGEDILSRIMFAEDAKDGLSKLHNLIIRTVNKLIDEIEHASKIATEKITSIVVAGNTTMIHLFLKLNPKNIRIDPYVATANFIPPIKIGELGIKVNPNGYLYCSPGISSYVGGDISADVLAANMHDRDELSLLIDVGTNGEIALGNKDWLIACSCSAGPAFEGGETKFGIRAMSGAIERVQIDKDSLDPVYETIDGITPRGICGSGLIDLVAELFHKGIIDKAGKIRSDLETTRIREGEDGPEYVIAWSYETAIKKDIVITEIDIKNIIRTKAALYAGASVLAKRMGLQFSELSKIYIAGGFGNYLDIDRAITLGLLPDISREKFEFIGNGAIAGARLVLLSKRKEDEIESIARKMTYLDLSHDPEFMHEYSAALFLPHTDMRRFSSTSTDFT